jgi:F0F1-type ATP synthase assembly protein I
MEPAPRPSFEPAGAGALLAATIVMAVGIGALIGLALGATGIGVLVGALAGIPAGVFAVYRRYRGF